MASFYDNPFSLVKDGAERLASLARMAASDASTAPNSATSAEAGQSPAGGDWAPYGRLNITPLGEFTTAGKRRIG